MTLPLDPMRLIALTPGAVFDLEHYDVFLEGQEAAAFNRDHDGISQDGVIELVNDGETHCLSAGMYREPERRPE